MRKLLLTLAIGLWTLDGFATTWYVAKTGGSDSNNCTQAQSSGTAKASIAAGLGCIGITAGTGSNHIVEVAAGTYIEAIVNNLPSGTSWSAPFTLRAKTGDTVTIKAGSANQFNLYIYLPTNLAFYTIIQGFVFDGTDANSGQMFLGSCCDGPRNIRFIGNSIVNSAHQNAVYVGQFSSGIEFLNNSFHDGAYAQPGGSGGDYGYPIYLTGNNCLIDHNTFYNIPSFVIHQYSANTPKPANNTISNNTIHDFGTAAAAAAILMASNISTATASIAFNNVIYNGTFNSAGNATGGIALSGPGSKAYNNTIYNCFGDGLFVSSIANSAELKNNISYGNGLIAGKANITIQGTPTGVIQTTNFTTNPTFVNVSTGDFHLQTTSSAKDGGTTIAAVTTDKDGFTRPQPAGGAYDIGAYEYIQAIPPPLSTISMTYPNGGENLLTSTPINITWTSNDTHTVKLEVSRDGGVTYPELIATGMTQTADANNFYVWTPTPPRSLTIKVRVTNLFDLVSDESNSVANIRGIYVK